MSFNYYVYLAGRLNRCEDRMISEGLPFCLQGIKNWLRTIRWWLTLHSTRLGIGAPFQMKYRYLTTSKTT